MSVMINNDPSIAIPGYFPFQSAPDEIICQIFQFLDPPSFLSGTLTSKRLKRVLDTSLIRLFENIFLKNVYLHSDVLSLFYTYAPLDVQSNIKSNTEVIVNTALSFEASRYGLPKRSVRQKLNNPNQKIALGAIICMLPFLFIALGASGVLPIGLNSLSKALCGKVIGFGGISLTALTAIVAGVRGSLVAHYNVRVDHYENGIRFMESNQLDIYLQDKVQPDEVFAIHDEIHKYIRLFFLRDADLRPASALIWYKNDPQSALKAWIFKERSFHKKHFIDLEALKIRIST